MKESKIAIRRWTEIHGESNVCNECRSEIQRARSLMLMLGLKVTIDQLVITNRMHWYVHVLRNVNNHAVRRESVEGQRKKGRPKK